MATISERLNYALSARNMKQVDLVNSTGIGKSSISTYLSGDYEPKQRNIYKLAKALQVNEAWLMGKDVPMDVFASTPTTSQHDIISIPIVGEVAAGYGAYTDNDIIDRIDIPKSWIKGNEEHVLLRVSGDSMEPEIHDGDLALIRIQTSVDSGNYAVVIIDNENGVIKRVMYDNNWVELQSLNTMYAPRRFENEDLQRIRVFGLVRKIIRNYND